VKHPEGRYIGDVSDKSAPTSVWDILFIYLYLALFEVHSAIRTSIDNERIVLERV
jgi:hypothetical protein